MNSKKIKKVSSKVFNCSEQDIKIVERLKLGMSNLVYLIEVKNNKYTFRIPGENAEVFVDRNNEKEGLLLIDKYDLCGKLVYFDDETGYKISEYIEGRVLYENVNDEDYTKVADTLHKLHNINPGYINPYNPFETLDYFESLSTLNTNEAYIKIKTRLLDHKEFLQKQKKVLCHNDSQPSNFVCDGKKIFLLDYEFIGLNDPIYDIACFGNNDINDGLKLLDKYLDHEPNLEEKKRFYLWRTFQNLQWYQVALYKHELKMDKGLNLNFKEIAENFLRNAEKSIKEVK